MTVDLSRRGSEPEWMDADDVDLPTLEACLRDLARVNALTLAHRPTLTWLSRVVERSRPETAFRILDVGFGYGDMLRRVARWARARGVPVELVGIDRNPWAKPIAEAKTPPDLPIRYVTADLFEFDPGEPFDLVISSLFAHHLDREDLVTFVHGMDAYTRHGWFINDLLRHPVAYRLAKVVFPVLRLDRMVVHDGPVSVSRAFTADDWTALLDAAGARRPDVTIERFFPFRLCVGCIR